MRIIYIMLNYILDADLSKGIITYKVYYALP